MKSGTSIQDHFPVIEGLERNMVLLLRWILIVMVGYLIVFSHPGRPFYHLPYLVFFVYLLSNMLLILFPQRWFEDDRFLFMILLIDLGMTSFTAYLAVRFDMEFYLVYFMILFMASYFRNRNFLFLMTAFLLVVFMVHSWLKYPNFFREPAHLLRVTFIFVISFFFHLMIESYNRVRREKNLLEKENQELEALMELARSIGRNKHLSEFLVRLNQVLRDKLRLERCMSILVDGQMKKARICFPEDTLETPLTVVNLEKNPALRNSLHKNTEEDIPPVSADNKSLSPYILKELPLTLKGNRWGSLYLRINTPNRKLSYREGYFLSRLSEIASLVIDNLENKGDLSS